MKKLSSLFVYIFALFILIFTPTLAKYQSHEFGDLFHADFTKSTVYLGVYIKNVEVVSNSNINNNVGYILPTHVTSSITPTSSTKSVTYKITVHNNTDVTYWYIGPSYDTKSNNNNLIDNGLTITTKDKLNDTGTTFNNQDWIPAQTEIDFYVTYTFNSTSTTALTTLINYRFDIKMDAVYDGFLSVLNDNTSTYAYNYLAQEFDKKYQANNEATTIISNTGTEKSIFDNIFGGNLTITDSKGNQVPVTVYIQRSNVDGTTNGDSYSNNGPTGCEYTLYITADNLKDEGTATVYAISYSCENGVWHQLGELYEGTCDASKLINGADDFVDSWVATPKTYQVADGIKYNVAASNGDQYDMLKTLTELMSTKDQDIYNDIDNSGILKKIYDIIQATLNLDHPAVIQLRTAFDNIRPFINIYNSGAEIKIKRDGNVTRSRLIPLLEDLQEAINYYNQTVAAAANKN